MAVEQIDYYFPGLFYIDDDKMFFKYKSICDSSCIVKSDLAYDDTVSNSCSYMVTFRADSSFDIQEVLLTFDLTNSNFIEGSAILFLPYGLTEDIRNEELADIYNYGIEIETWNVELGDYLPIDKTLIMREHTINNIINESK